PIVNSRALLITTKPPISHHAPWINLISYTINDSAGGNNNGIPEPNETIELIIQIKNNGDTIVSNVTGILNTLSSSVLVIDSVASFGDMDIGQVCDNSSNPYVLQVVANPLDTLVGIGIHLSGNDGNYNTTAYFTLRIHSGAGINESNSAIANGIVFRVYPNPFLEKINIRYAIPDDQKSEVSLKIYDVSGRLVKTFHSASKNQHHVSNIVWYGEDDLGRKLPAGIYFILLEENDFKLIKKTIMLK
ncbi:MAG: T9SS type A sorting domain-containing protein, partial [bacterium]